MIKTMGSTIGAVIGVALVVAALWSWNEAARLAMFWKSPDIGAWAIRSAAVAAVAGAQALLLMCVASQGFPRRSRAEGHHASRRDVFATGLKLGAGLICAGAMVSAVALGFAGR